MSTGTGLQTFMGGAVRPANVAAAFDSEGNIREKLSLPTLSIKGKQFSMKINGETIALTKTDADTGERVNLGFVNVVVVAMNPNRSRTFFAKAYVPGENQMPACYSSDGVKPDTDVKTPVSATCASCPNSVKGSRIKEGREGYACESKKRLAIWPAAMLSNPELKLPVMQLILPMTSIWDKENKQNDAEMWFAWDNYVDDLRARGVKHTGEVVTRIRFDNTEHPKLLFKAVRWLDDSEHARFGELAAVKGIMNSDDVKKLLFGKMYDEDAVAVVETAAAAPVPAKPAVSEDDDGFAGAAKAASTAVAEPAKVADKPKTPKATKAPAEVPAKTPAAEPSKAPAPVAAAAPSAALQQLAAQWE